MNRRKVKVFLYLLFTLGFLYNNVMAQNNWAWMNGSSTTTNVLPAHGTQGTPSSTNTPGSILGAATWTDNAGNLWMFGGYCYGYGYSNAVWKYTISTNQWTWVKGSSSPNQFGNYGTINTASSTNNPGGRYLCEGWVDNSGNFWIYGGAGYSASSSGYLSDLWRYNPTTNQWTWMKGSNAPNAAGNYGTLTVSQSTNNPGGRYSYTTFKDASGNLWMFGGYGYAANTTTVGDLNDLWKYEMSTGNWVWMKGSNLLSQTGLYGTMTVASSTATPGARRQPTSWTDVNGDFWIFGGYGTIASSTLALTNDLWKYTVSTGNWTWMRGSSTPNSFGWYGSLGVTASNNDPGARYYTSACGSDNQGNLWLFGGYGYSASSASRLNDLWRYDRSTNQWTWMKGSSVPNQVGIYGTLTVASATNVPGGRYLNTSWVDNSGWLWVYGGNGYTTVDVGYMNDMWRFDLCNAPASPTNAGTTQDMYICSGSSATLTAASSSSINWYATSTSTTVLGTGSVFITPGLSAMGSSTIYTYYADSYSCSASASRAAFNVTVNPTPTITVNSGTVCSGGAFVMIPSGAVSYTYSGGSQVMFPTSSTSYSVTGTNFQGCTSTQAAVAQVTVHPLPSVSVNSGTSCSGSSFVIVPSGASSYTVSGGTFTVSPTTNTFYLVTGTSSLGCTALVPAVANVVVFGTTAISVNSGSICPGNSFTLNPSGALTSYTYSSGSAVVSPTATSTYTVAGTNSVGCVSSAVSTVNVYSSPVISVNSGSVCIGNSFTLTPSGASSYTYSSGSPVVSPTTTSTYFVMGTSSVGCVSPMAAIATVSVYNLPTVSVSGGTICAGQSFTLAPSGATTYTYSSGSPVVSPTTTSTYSVYGTNGQGCTSASPAVASVVVGNAPLISVNSGTICAGSSFTLSASGASTYTFLPAGPVVSPGTTSSYTVTGTNSVGCISAPAISTISVRAVPVISVNSGSICAGNNFSIVPSGALTYTVSGGSFVVSPSSNSSYSVSGTGTNGCVSNTPAISSVVVFSNPVISVNSGSVCAGASFTLSPSGASTYTYSGGSAIVTPTVTSSYTVSGSSTAGCVSTVAAVANVTVRPRPVISVNNGSICAGNSFTLLPTGAQTYTYSGGSAVVSPTVSSNYSVSGTNSFGCVSQSPAVATVVVSQTLTITVNSGSVCSGKSFTLLPGGANSYTYSSGSAVVSPSITSNYTVTGTNTAGCISNPAVATVSVVVSPVVSVSSGSVCSGNNFTLNPTGAASYTYSSGSAMVSPTASSIYTITGSNTLGCVSSPVQASVTVINLPVISVSSGSICSGGSYSLMVSGASTYTYSSGTAVVSPTINSTYSVTGTSSAGCVATAVAVSTVNVIQRPVISVNSGSICAGSSFTINASGAQTYTYSGGSAIVSPGSSTVYNVSGTSSLGCVSASAATSSVTVLSTPVISVSSGTICSGNSYTLNASGAISYTYSSGSAIVSPTSNTNYSVTGTGTNGCVSGASVANVVVNALPVITVNSGSICEGQSFTLTPGGATTYTYSGGSNVVSPSVTTSYSVSGSSAAGCISGSGAVATVTVSPRPVISAANGTICRGASFTISPGGANTYTFQGGSAVVSPTVTSTYSVSGTNTAGCQSATPALVMVNVTNTFFISMGSGTICQGNTFTLVPNGAATYTISGGNAVVSPGSTSVYSVSGTSSLGCLTASPATATVTVLSPPTISVNSGSICAGNSFSINPTGGVNYTISGGSSIVSPGASSTYSVIGSGNNGCVSSPVFANVSVIALPVISVNSGSVCDGGSFTLNPSGAATYTFSSGGPVVTPSINSTYSVSGTSSVGCVSSSAAVATVVVHANPTVVVSSGTICPGGSFTFNPIGAANYTYSSGSAIVSPTVSATYSVIGSSSVGCVSQIVTVTVGVSPNPNITVSGGTVCSGQSFTLNPSGVSSYTFSSGSAVVTPSVTTSYTVTGSSAGCTNTLGAVAVVSVVPLPTVSASGGAVCSGSSFTINPTGALTYTVSGGNTVVSPTATSVYTISGTDNSGCVSSPVLITVTVNNTPTVTVNSGSICSGSSFTLQPSGASTYSFSSGTAIVSPVANTSYTVYGTDVNGCNGIAVADITVHALPQLSLSPTPSVICAGETLNIFASGAANYAWLVNGTVLATGMPSLSIGLPQTSTIVVNGQSAEGCTDTRSLVVAVDPCTGIINYSTSKIVSVYPNPTEGRFFVEAESGAELVIVNDLGQVIFETVIRDTGEEIILDNRAKGVYFISIKSGKQTWHFKLVHH